MRYEVTEHTADVGIVAYGASLEELFENAAYGMFDLMFDLQSLDADMETELTIEGEDASELLYGWLSELLYRFEVDEIAWCRFDVALERGVLRGQVGGVTLAGLELRGSPIKAVTLHGLEVARVGTRLTARVLFDV